LGYSGTFLGKRGPICEFWDIFLGLGTIFDKKGHFGDSGTFWRERGHSRKFGDTGRFQGSPEAPEPPCSPKNREALDSRKNSRRRGDPNLSPSAAWIDNRLHPSYPGASTQSSREFSRPWNSMAGCPDCTDARSVAPSFPPTPPPIAKSSKRDAGSTPSERRPTSSTKTAVSRRPGGVGTEIVREVLVCPSCSEEPSVLSSVGCGPPVLALAA
jgi:hypothetical protein